MDQLLDTQDPAWPLVQGWIAAARNPVDVLPRDTAAARAVLAHLQVTTRSPMGAIAYETGGILVDSGWVRVLGAGCSRLNGSLLSWNPDTSKMVIIALDAIGGVFAVNGGGLPGPRGKVFYFAPDSLEWECTQQGYSGWLEWLLTGDLQRFYADSRWPSWAADVATLPCDQAYSIYPFPFAKEGGPVPRRSRKAVPNQELVSLYFSTAAQLHPGPGPQ